MSSVYFVKEPTLSFFKFERNPLLRFRGEEERFGKASVAQNWKVLSFFVRRTDSSLRSFAVAATKAAAAAAEGAGKRVREVEAMANAMKEQLRALTEAVTRIETVVTASKKSAPEESRSEASTVQKERQSRKEMGRKERRIWAAVSEKVVQNRESLGLPSHRLPFAGFSPA
jgi:hypothetical protein